MPVQVTWLYPGRVLYTQFYGAISLAEFQQLSVESAELLTAGTPPLYAISDISRIQNELTDIRGVRDTLKPDPRLHLSIMIGTNALSRFVATLLTKALGMHMRFFDTLDEAVAYLCTIDLTLDRARFVAVPETPEA